MDRAVGRFSLNKQANTLWNFNYRSIIVAVSAYRHEVCKLSYGISVYNDSQYSQIDSVTPRLCVIHSGSYWGQAYVVVEFPAPVTTPEPPCVFIRPAEGGAILHGSMNINGGPGNWTGFSIALTNITHITSGTWFAAVFRSTKPSTYGMRIWDENGVEIYDTASPAVIVSTASHLWGYSGRVQLSIGFAYTWICQLPGSIGVNDHFMINPFSRWMLTSHVSDSIRTGVTMNPTSRQLILYAVGATLPYTEIGHLSAVIARIKR